MEQRPEIIVPNEAAAPQQPDGEQQPPVSQPGKLLRIASMIRELVEEVRQTTLDEQGSKRLADVYKSSIDQLKDSLSEELQQELESLALPLEAGASEGEVRVAQAQLLGWLEGLFHGIQAALWAQHMQAQSALEQMRRRQLPSGQGGPEGPEGPGTPGQYL